MIQGITFSCTSREASSCEICESKTPAQLSADLEKAGTVLRRRTEISRSSPSANDRICDRLSAACCLSGWSNSSTYMGLKQAVLRERRYIDVRYILFVLANRVQEPLHELEILLVNGG